MKSSDYQLLPHVHMGYDRPEKLNNLVYTAIAYDFGYSELDTESLHANWISDLKR